MVVIFITNSHCNRNRHRTQRFSLRISRTIESEWRNWVDVLSRWSPTKTRIKPQRRRILRRHSIPNSRSSSMRISFSSPRIKVIRKRRSVSFLWWTKMAVGTRLVKGLTTAIRTMIKAGTTKKKSKRMTLKTTSTTRTTFYHLQWTASQQSSTKKKRNRLKSNSSKIECSSKLNSVKPNWINSMEFKRRISLWPMQLQWIIRQHLIIMRSAAIIVGSESQ